MKKILFLQIKGNSVGGLWFVNKKLGEKFKKEHYDVEVLNIRNDPGNNGVEDVNFKITTINKKDLWEITHRRDVLNSIKKIKFFRTLIKYLEDYFKLKKDYKIATNYIKDYNPDYIIATNCELLKIIPKCYLNRTIYHHHTSLRESIKNRYLRNSLFKYNKKIHFLWLTEATMDFAISIGLKNNHFIYNPIKFNTDKIADVCENKMIRIITRSSYEKRIDLMLEIVNEAFNKVSDKEWNFEIYGPGNIEELINKYNTPRIQHKGITNRPKDLLLKSSINLNTSIFEGFSLSILEAGECGIPTISFNFGESVFEQIDNKVTGFIVQSKEEFIEKLVYLMSNPKKLKDMSLKVKEYHKRFNIDNIFLEWEKLFNKISR